MKFYKDPNTKQVFAFEEDGSQDDLILDHYEELADDDSVEAAKNDYWDHDFGQRSYDKKRSYEYPTLGDQLDMIFKSGVLDGTEWATTIQAVKDKYPKEES